MAMTSKVALTLPKHKTKKGHSPWHGWLLPALAEAMLLVSFLLWLSGSGDQYHGFAAVYAWVIYGLLANAFLFLWIGRTDDEEISQRH